MATSEFIMLRLSDGYEAAARLWVPASVRGAVLYLHGIQSHGGWFERSAERLTEEGMAVLLPDRRGSGRNERDRGHARSARRLLDDCTEWLNELQARTGVSRAHVVGVSWGGKLALALARHAPSRVASLSLVAPGLFARIDLPLVQKLLVACCLLVHRRAPFDIPLSEPELFTANPQRQAFIHADPLRLQRVTAAFLFASRRLDNYARGIASSRRPCPLHVFLAGQDHIIDNERTREFVRRLGWAQRRITEYPDAQHTLEFEPDPQAYLADLVAWVAGNSES